MIIWSKSCPFPRNIMLFTGLQHVNTKKCKHSNSVKYIETNVNRTAFSTLLQEFHGPGIAHANQSRVTYKPECSCPGWTNRLGLHGLRLRNMRFQSWLANESFCNSGSVCNFKYYDYRSQCLGNVGKSFLEMGSLTLLKDYQRFKNCSNKWKIWTKK